MTSTPEQRRPFVSVIIATRNRQALLARTLDALAAQRLPRDQFEIIIADNGSTDGTRSVAEAARPASAEIRYLYVAQPGKSHAVNAAFAVARGEIFALTDDDVQPHADWLQQIVAVMEETGADFVAGRVLPTWEVAPPRWVSPALHGVLAIPDNGDRRIDISAGSNARVVPIGANMAVRREAVKRAGGLRGDLGKLEGTLRTGEDHEFFLRLLHTGCRGVYEPTAVVRHWVPANRLTRSYFRQWLYQNGRDVARLEAAYPPASPRLLAVPRHLWRRAAADAFTSITPDSGVRFAALTQLGWFAGYVRQAWFGPSQSGSGQSGAAQETATDGAATPRSFATLWPVIGKNRWR